MTFDWPNSDLFLLTFLGCDGIPWRAKVSEWTQRWNSEEEKKMSASTSSDANNRWAQDEQKILQWRRHHQLFKENLNLQLEKSHFFYDPPFIIWFTLQFSIFYDQFSAVELLLCNFYWTNVLTLSSPKSRLINFKEVLKVYFKSAS